MRKNRGNEGKMIYASQNQPEFPISTCVSVPYAQMEMTESEIHWKFTVVLELSDGTTIMTKHRYSEFYELHKQWTSKHPTLQSTGIEFPKRMVTVTDADIAVRAFDLETYLRRVCTIHACLPFVAKLLKCKESELEAALNELAEKELQPHPFAANTGPFGGYATPHQPMLAEAQLGMMGSGSSMTLGSTMTYSSNPFNDGFVAHPYHGNLDSYPALGGSQPNLIATNEFQAQPFQPNQRRTTWFMPQFGNGMWGGNASNSNYVNLSATEPPPVKPQKMSFSIQGMRMPTFSLMPRRKEAPELPPRPVKKKNRLARKPSMIPAKLPLRSFRPMKKPPPEPIPVEGVKASDAEPPAQKKAVGITNIATKKGRKGVELPPLRPSAVGVDVTNRVKFFERK